MLFETRDTVSWWLRIVAVALAIAIVVTGGLLIGWDAYFGQMEGTRYKSQGGVDINNTTINEGDGDKGPNLEELEPADSGEEENNSEITGETIHPSQLNSLKDNIKQWMNTGSAVHDSNVTNILLVGMDDNYSKTLSDHGRADAMMLMSINHKTKTITLASLMRDQYAYIVHNGKGSFQKLHHSLNYGPATLIQMLERYYKVTIDNYVIVNFASVAKVIDALGGITVTIEPNEAKYLRDTCGWHISYGESTIGVDGAHALTYMRIRKGSTGGDTARTGRQRKVIMTMMNEAKQCSLTELVGVVNAMIPYVRTGLSSTEVLAYATNALTGGWFNYEIKQVVLPDDDCAVGFMNPEDGGWYWKTDFPIAAQKLQTALYGKTNIELEKNRKSWIK